VTRSFLRLSLVAALLCGLDAPAVLLQGYAWTTMLLRGARSGSISRAITQTFDGEHPCAVCERVRGSAPAQSLSAAPQPKADVFLPLGAPAPAASRERVVVAVRFAAVPSRAAAPPVPPPNARAC
jgi:hypothetical protein